MTDDIDQRLINALMADSRDCPSRLSPRSAGYRPRASPNACASWKNVA